MHLAFDAKLPEVFTVVSSTVARNPAFGTVIQESLSTWLRNEDEKRAKAVRSAEDDEGVSSKSQKIGRLLSAVFKPQDGLDKSVLAELTVDFLVLAHHPEIGEDAQVSWISLVQSVGLDPATVVFDHRERVLENLWDAAGTPPVDTRFAEAACRAVTTLTFIHPAVYVPAFISQIKDDLRPSQLDFVGLEERGIWITPADQTYVDVLAPKKDAVENKNRKDYATEKWEQEVRESIAKKKTTSMASLSKADKAAVSAQLAKEAAVRDRIVVVQAKLRRGIELVSSVINSNAEAMERHAGELARMMLASVFAAGSFLVTERAFQVFLVSLRQSRMRFC